MISRRELGKRGSEVDFGRGGGVVCSHKVGVRVHIARE
jgi:hypothetical protein